MAQSTDEMMRRFRQGTAEADRGASPTIGFRTLFARTAEILIPSTNRLPVDFDSTPIQLSDGTPIFIEGYSDPNGSAVVIPPAAPAAPAMFYDEEDV